jgi:hypothetical protein
MKALRRVSLGLGALVLLYPIWILARESRKDPGVELRASLEDGRLIFDLRPRDANGLLDVLVFDKETGRPFWWLNLNYHPGGRVTYGSTPSGFTTLNGTTPRARREFPVEEAPKELPREREIVVQVGYQYDRWIGASAGSVQYLLTISAAGEIASRKASEWSVVSSSELRPR